MSATKTKQLTFDLTRNAVLMRLVLGMAGTKRKSDALTDAAASGTESEESRVDGNVHLLNSLDLKGLTNVQSAARGYFYSRTSPWDNNAYRLVPVALYVEIKARLERYRNDHHDEVEQVVGRRDDLAKEYVRTVGKQVAAEIPFPTAEQLRKNFRFDVREMALARTEDVRLNSLDDDALNQLKAELEQGMAERMAEAQAELITRIRKTVERIKRVTGKEKTRIYDSLETSVQEIVQVLPAMNLSNDPKIARAIKLVADQLGGLDVETLKTDDKTRAATHKAASSVLDHLLKL